MNVSILFPCDYFNNKKVDEDYLEEYKVAQELGFNTIFINYEELENGSIKLSSNEFEEGLCIYRGWMLKPETYKNLYDYLENKGLTLINTHEEYSNCHLFPLSYGLLEQFTPKINVFSKDEVIDWDKIRQEYNRFMVKDYVKSVKGSDFPNYFDSSFTNNELDKYIEKFKELRGELFTKGIVIKEFVDLNKVNDNTNEYRAFYLKGELLTICKNSNQPLGVKEVPESLIKQLPVLESNFYTVDFAEKSNGEFVVIETGDGQVSGLPDEQDVREFYNRIKLSSL